MIPNPACDLSAKAEEAYFEAWREWKLRNYDYLREISTPAALHKWNADSAKIYKLYAEHILTSERPLLASLTTSLHVIDSTKDVSLLYEFAIVMYLRCRGLKHEYNTSVRIMLRDQPEDLVKEVVKRFLKVTEWQLAGFIRRGEVPVAGE